MTPLQAPDSAPYRADAHRVDAVAVGAAVCIVLGWFVLSTLDTNLSGMRLSFHFYDMWTVLAHPSRLVTGLTDGDRLKGALFGAVCLAALAGVFVPHPRDSGRVRVAYLAPLVLMIACGAVLYERTSGDLFAATSDPGSLGAHLTALANEVAGRISAAVSRHISLGLGAYLAFVASLVLAARALPKPRASMRYFWKV